MTDFRALCAELLEHATTAQAVAVGEGLWDGDEDGDLFNRTRAALAEPQGEGPPLQPVQVESADIRYEFSVMDGDYVEQAGGSAPTIEQARDEGLHYLAQYSQDGPHTLELRRVEILPLPREVQP